MRYLAVLLGLSNRAFGTRPPDAAPAKPGRETDFLWAPSLPVEDRTGVLLDPQVDFQDRVGVFVWPKAAGRSPVTKGKGEKGLVGLWCVHPPRPSLPLVASQTHTNGVLSGAASTADHSCMAMRPRRPNWLVRLDAGFAVVILTWLR
jgi:hypothetical protein